MHLCCVSELYSSYASPARVDIQKSNDIGDCSKDVHLEVFVQQVGRRVNDEYNIGLLTTCLWKFQCIQNNHEILKYKSIRIIYANNPVFYK